MDYFYQGALRWNFGFENPNHAAALIAALLPFVWLAGRIWQPARFPLRVVWEAVCAALLIGGWALLGLTVSRSGLVAATAAFIWIGWRTFPAWRGRRMFVAGCALVCAGVAVTTGILPRTTATLVTPDASATNRLTLWRGALEMLAIAPQGVGTGHSGAFFMNWLQASDATGGYRTMVNSYLTFLTEWGLPFGVLAGFVFLALVLVFIPGKTSSSALTNSAIACQAALIAFAVAGFFSTTMETIQVWIPAMIALGGLVGLTLGSGRTRRLGFRPALGLAAGLSVGLVVLLWAAGCLLQAGNPLSLRFVKTKNRSILAVRSRHLGHGENAELLVFPDTSVMGQRYGKALRLLVTEHNFPLTVHENPSGFQSTSGWMMAGGKYGAQGDGQKGIILLAPEIPSAPEKMPEGGRHASVVIFQPGFDEDGRVAFWNEVAIRNPEAIQVIPVPGFGSDLSQAWPDIVEKLRALFSRVEPSN